MSAKLEFLLVTDCLLDCRPIVRSYRIDYVREVNIESITKIKDWEWHGNQNLTSYEQAIQYIENGDIVIFDLYSPRWGHFGASAEPFGSHYLFSLWIDIGMKSELDTNVVSRTNRAYYDHFYYEFCKLIKELHISFNLLAIGVETVLEYSDTIEEIIKKARNISAWIIDARSTFTFPRTQYKVSLMKDINAYLLERFV